MGIHCGFSRLKGPRAQGIVCAERHGIHPVTMTLKGTAQHTLGEEEPGQTYMETHLASRGEREITPIPHH